MISVVLSTDMFQHFSLLAVWNAKVEAQPDIWAWRERMLMLVMTMHLADIINPARPASIAVKWGTLIVQECMQQVRFVSLSRSLSHICNENIRTLLLTVRVADTHRRQACVVCAE
jgi:hypothetical protein